MIRNERQETYAASKHLKNVLISCEQVEALLRKNLVLNSMRLLRLPLGPIGESGGSWA